MEPTGEQIQMSPAPQDEKSIGPAIGVIIIILALVLGGLYFWGQTETNRTQNKSQNIEGQEASADAQAEIQLLQSQGESDDLDSIEADLNNTDFSGLGSEMNSIETESEGSGQIELE